MLSIADFIFKSFFAIFVIQYIDTDYIGNNDVSIDGICRYSSDIDYGLFNVMDELLNMGNDAC
jgi:hypothetical protein